MRTRLPFALSQGARIFELGQGGRRAIWSGIDAACTPIAALAIAAGLIHALGAEDYGFIVVALAVSGISTAINPAIAIATTKFVSEAKGHELGGMEVSKVVTGSLIVVAAIAAIFTLLIVVLERPLASLIFGSAEAAARPDVGTVLLLAVISVCLQQFDGVFAATLKGLEQFKRQAVVEICVRTVLASSVVAMGAMTRDARFVLATYCCVCGVASIFRGAVVLRCMGGVSLFCWPHRSNFIALIHVGGWMWLNATASIVFVSADRIVIGRVSGAAAAAEYNVYIQIAQIVHFLPASLLAFCYPAFSRLGARKDQNLPTIRRLFKKYMLVGVGIGAALATCVLLLRHPITRFIGGGVFASRNDIVLLVLVAGFLLLVLNIVPYYLSLALGRPRAVSLISTLSMTVSVLLMLILTPALGPSGAAIARLAYGLGALSLFIPANRALRLR